MDSLSQVDTFATALEQSNHIFDLSINFSWSPSRQELEATLEHLSKCAICVLEINGAALAHSQWGHSRDLFAHYFGVNIIQYRSGKLITLSSYPRSFESYIYFGHNMKVYGLLFEGVVNRHDVGWAELGSNLFEFYNRLESAMESDN